MWTEMHVCFEVPNLFLRCVIYFRTDPSINHSKSPIYISDVLIICYKQFKLYL